MAMPASPTSTKSGASPVFYCGWGNLRRGGAVPPGADLYGLASHDRRLVGTDVGELDRSRRRWWPRFFRAETRRARCTLKRVGPLQFGGLVVFVILSRGLEFATIPVAKTFSSPSGSSCMTSIRALWTH